VAAVAARIKSRANNINGYYPPAPYRGNLIRLCGMFFDKQIKSPLGDLGVERDLGVKMQAAVKMFS